jgi:hypothetical protein
VLFVFLTGCPLESNYPIKADHSEKVDSTLVGNWKRIRIKSTDDTTETVAIRISNDTTYRVMRKGKEQNGDVISQPLVHYKVHATRIDTHVYFNLLISTVDGNSPKSNLYRFARVKIKSGPTGDTLISDVVSGDRVTSASQKEFTDRFPNFQSQFDDEYSAVYVKHKPSKKAK